MVVSAEAIDRKRVIVAEKQIKEKYWHSSVSLRVVLIRQGAFTDDGAFPMRVAGPPNLTQKLLMEKALPFVTRTAQD